jgi:hypothetical protein
VGRPFATLVPDTRAPADAQVDYTIEHAQSTEGPTLASPRPLASPRLASHPTQFQHLTVTRVHACECDPREQVLKGSAPAGLNLRKMWAMSFFYFLLLLFFLWEAWRSWKQKQRLHAVLLVLLFLALLAHQVAGSASRAPDSHARACALRRGRRRVRHFTAQSAACPGDCGHTRERLCGPAVEPRRRRRRIDVVGRL